MKKQFFLGFFLICLSVVGADSVFAAKHFVFEDRPVVTELNDQNPSALPKSNDFDLIEYSVTSIARYPVVRYMDPRRIKRSQDVNAMDQVPTSSWYTPRLGYQPLSGSDLVKGPVDQGAPQKPFRIVKAKSGGNSPGFVIKDNRGLKYLIKFDPLDFPNTESTSNLVLNRLFWGFGYNVSEDHLFLFNENDFTVDLKNPEDQDLVDVVLFGATPGQDGNYRTTASLYLQGNILGHILPKGTRKGDINDRIDHENLRILRALRVFNAWTQNTGMRSDNTLVVYEGEPGHGHVVRYLLDFGEGLGAHGLGKAWRWDGYEHIFDFADMLKKALTLGKVEAWENVEGDLWDQKVFFEADAFDPKTWREVMQFEPMRHSLADDNYWAAKIVGAVSEDQLRELLNAAKHPDHDQSTYLLETLLKRQKKVLDYHLYQVSPIESKGIQNGQLQLEDMGKKLLPGQNAIDYEIRFYNKGNKQLQEKVSRRSESTDFSVPIEQALASSKDGYLRVEVQVIRNGQKTPRPAEFHVRQSASGGSKVVGVVH